MRQIKVDTTEAKECAKCGRSGVPIYRHHKGFDSFLGRFNKGIGYRYYSYQDCVHLCFDHHCEIHFIYLPYIEKWVNRTADGARLFRKILIGVCDRWLTGKVKTPEIPKGYIRKFEKDLKEWERARDAG